MRRGFTLVELLVVIGIIALLVGILLPVLGNARASASQVRALSDVRQLLVAHQFYRLEHEGRVPLAYPPDELEGEPFQTEFEGFTWAGLEARRYPIRLVAYLEDVWEIVYSGRYFPDPDNPSAVYDLGVAPTYGINAVFVGGSGDFRERGFVNLGKASFDFSSNSKYIAGGGPDGPSFMTPNVNRHVVFRETEVREPSSLIVFADAKLRGGPFSSGDGYNNVHGPISNGQLWELEPDPEGGRDTIKVVGFRAIGVPEGRFGKGAAVGFFDGHAESRFPDELTDMRLWANWADSETYDFVP
ncbi:MAG: type II secretion system protein [Planctomycetota bacterium]